MTAPYADPAMDGAAGWSATRRRVDGVALHAVAAGPEDGPLVLLLHGFPEFWWGWRRQIGPLAAAGFRVLAPDLRGYNLSDKPRRLEAYALDTLAADVAGLIAAEGRDAAHLVGHDWGGILAWGTAARHPERVRRLAVLNAPHPDTLGPEMLRHPAQALRSAYVGFFQLPLLPEALLRAGDFALLRRSMAASARPGTFSRADLDRYAEAWARPGALTAMLDWYRALRLRPRGDAPRRIRAPALVVWGARDLFLGRHLAEAALALCDDGRAEVLGGATHWVHLEEPAAVNAALVRFFGRG